MRNSLSFAVVCRVITNLVFLVTGFVSLKLYALYLTKEIYGSVIVANQFLVYLPLISGGFSMVVSREMLASGDAEVTRKGAFFNKTLQTYIFLLALLISCVAMIIYSQTSVARSTGLSFWLFFAIGIASAVSFYSGGQFGLMTSLGRQIETILLTLAWGVLGFAILWIGFALGFGVWAMPLSTGLGGAFLLPFAWMLQRRLVPGLPVISWRHESNFWSRLKEIWRPSLAWLQSQFSIIALFTVDIILVGFIFGPATATLYGVLSRVGQMSRQIIQALSETVWPKLTQETDPQRKAEVMRKVDRLNAWIAGSWHGAMLATVQPFLVWMTATDWVAGPVIIWLMILRNLIVSLSSPHSYGLLSEGRFKEIARATQMELVCLAVAASLFGHFFGVNGFAFGVFVATAGGSLWYFTYLYFKPPKEASWFDEWRAIYARAIISVALAFAIASGVWTLEKALFGAPGWGAMIAGGCGLAAGLGIALAFGFSQSSGQTRMLMGRIKLPTRW